MAILLSQPVLAGDPEKPIRCAVSVNLDARTVSVEGIGAFALSPTQRDDAAACLDCRRAEGLSAKLADGRLWLRGDTPGAQGHLVGVLEPVAPTPEPAPAPTPAPAPALALDPAPTPEPVRAPRRRLG